MYNALPKNEKTFELDVVGDTTNLPYTGKFTVKCVLDMAGKHSLELEKTRLMADYANPSNGLAGIAITLSTVRAKIVKSPDWWDNTDNGAQIMDENVIMRLFDECGKAEAEWRTQLKKNAEEAQKGNVPKES